MEQQVEVLCNGIGCGRAEVPHPSGQIERVVVRGWHGYPHVHPHQEPGKSYIEVLGAVPDTSVTVTFNVEGV